MAVYQIIFEILLYITEGWIVFYYARGMFEQKHKTAISLPCILCGYAILFFVYQFDDAFLNSCAILIINTLIFISLYNCNLKTAFFHSVLLLCVMVACEWILIFTISTILHEDFNAYQGDFHIHVLNVVFSKLVYYLILIVIVKFFSKSKRYNKNESIFWILLIMPFTSLVVLLTFRYVTYEIALSAKMQIICSVASGLLLIANIVVFFIYEYSIRNLEKLFELQTIEQKQKTDETYLAVLEQNNTDLKVFTHDIKNHLEQICNLTDSESIRSYISKLYGTVNQYETIGISNNKTLDIIISKYQALCSNKNIEISFNVKTANFSFVDDVDLSTILNNILDNATEAAQQSKKRKITVDIFTKQAYEVLKVKNSCDLPPRTKNTQLITKKTNSEIHGFGLQSVRRTLKKYNGVLDWTYDEDRKIFITTIAIPKE